MGVPLWGGAGGCGHGGKMLGKIVGKPDGMGKTLGMGGSELGNPDGNTNGGG